MSRTAVTITMLGILLLAGNNPVSAYVWKCHTPQGDFWTSQPSTSDDCQEYDDQYNPSAAPPPGTPTASAAVSGQVVVPVPVPVPAPVPYIYPPYYYAPGYYAPGFYGAVIIRPPFGYPYRHFYGGHWHGGGHFRH